MMLIKNIDNMIYFHDHLEKQTQNWVYRFSVLASTRYEELKWIVEITHKQRAKEIEVPENQFIFIRKYFIQNQRDQDTEK